MVSPLLTSPVQRWGWRGEGGGSGGKEQEALSRNQDPGTNSVLQKVCLCNGDIKKAISTRSHLLEAHR